jgi:hypothetical protein
MAAEMGRIVSEPSPERYKQLKHAFQLLASAELGSWPTAECLADEASLQSRVELLCVLFDIIPRYELRWLGAVLTVWQRLFPDGQPVAAQELRASAREVLKSDAGSTVNVLRDRNWARALAMVKVKGLTGDIDGTAAVARRPGIKFTDQDAAALCAQGLRNWFDQLETNPRWTKISAAAPGAPSVAIEKIFVELFAIEDDVMADTEALEAVGRSFRRRMTSKQPVVSIQTMVARTLERCIVIGEPGSGKTTLVQWIARTVFLEQLPDFDLALVVKLSAFADALTRRTNLSLIEYFFESVAKKRDAEDWSMAGHWMRCVAQERGRCLLLLDGWDEVPMALRSAVRQSMDWERPYFVTITTSRPSGLPRELWNDGVVDFFHIAGLAPRASETLVRNILKSLNRDELVPTVLKRITTEDDFREMSTNPFLLGMLVRVLAHPAAHGAQLRTLADVYCQVAAWIQQHHDETATDGIRLTGEHFNSLERLSYFLLFEDEMPRYVFRGNELAERMHNLPVLPVMRSRFVNRTDPDFDEFGFLHATFQEYFAAAFVATLTDGAMDQFLDRTFRSASRSVVLEFFAGLGGAAQRRCRERAREWLGLRDRFQKTLLRVAKLAAVGRWATSDADGLVKAVREELWRELQRNQEGPVAAEIVEALAELDARNLCMLAHQSAELSTWVINCIVESVPATVAKELCLDELLTPEWQDYAGFDLRGGATAEETERIRSCLGDQTAAKEDQFEAVIHAGAARDAGSVPALRDITADPRQETGMRHQAIDSLGAIGGRQAVDCLVDVVFGKMEGLPEGPRLAATMLREVSGSRAALDPTGRDRLLRGLAVLSPNEPAIEHLLTALEGHTIRDGGDLIAMLVKTRDVPQEIRSKAVCVLGNIADRALVASVVAEIETEPSDYVAAMLLHMACGRSLPVPLKWLERKIQAARDRVQSHRLLKRYVLALAHASRAEWSGAREYLNRLVKEALADTTTEADSAKGVAQALTRATNPGQLLLSRPVLNQARELLARFSQRPDAKEEGRVLLAVSIVGHFSCTSAVRELRMSLDASLKLESTAHQQEERSNRAAIAIAEVLAELAPNELLHYSADCAPVQSVLQSRASQRGWWVFEDRILDAEGIEIANVVSPVAASDIGSEPGDLKSARTDDGTSISLEEATRNQMDNLLDSVMVPDKKLIYLTYFFNIGRYVELGKAATRKDIAVALGRRPDDITRHIGGMARILKDSLKQSDLWDLVVTDGKQDPQCRLTEWGKGVMRWLRRKHPNHCNS